MHARTFGFAVAAQASLLALGLLSGCDRKADAEYRQIADREKDPVPPLYQGPLVVQGTFHGTQRVTYSERGRRRMDWSYPSGGSWSVADPTAGIVYHWVDFGRDRGVLKTAQMTSGTKATLQRWLGRTVAQRLGPCSAAGETGFIYRYTRGPNLKGPGGNYIEACITGDGVVLTESIGADKLGSSGYSAPPERMFTATAVRRGPLPPGTFDIPANLHEDGRR